MQNDHRVKLIIAVLLGGLMLVGCGRKQPPASAIPEVAIVTVSPERTVLTTELPGRTYAYLVAEIRPQETGINQKRLFEEGTHVRAGNIL